MPSSNRDDFSDNTKVALAKRSGYLCAICKALTVGPSAESPLSVTNVGVAAHIAAAAPGGKRYSRFMSSSQRRAIANGIWLCQTHAKAIDDDAVSWTAEKLHAIKAQHEASITPMLGVPRHRVLDVRDIASPPKAIEVREYAFAPVGGLLEPYKTLIKPVLEDRRLEDKDELGMLLCGSKPEEPHDASWRTPWTVFVNPEWLRWFLKGQDAGFKAALQVPPEHVYGKIPAWPDTFFEFMVAIVMANATFVWRRSPEGYLSLVQP